jgi:hypothetical protein
MVIHTSTASIVAPVKKVSSPAQSTPAPAPAGQQDPLVQAQSIVSGEQTDMSKITAQLNAMQEKMPKLTPPPTQQTVDPLKSFGSAATMIAVLGSLLTRAPLTSALNSAAAAMNSIQNKNMQDYQIHYNNWKQNTDFAIQQSQMLEQQYQDILGTAKLTNEQKTAQASMLATISQDQAMNAHLKNSDLQGAERLSIARAKAGSDMAVNAAQIEQIHETLMANPLTYATALAVDDFVTKNNRQPSADEYAGIQAHVNDVLNGNAEVPDSPALKQAQETAAQVDSLQKKPQTIGGVYYTPADLKAVQKAGPDATNLTPTQMKLKALLRRAESTNTLTALADPTAPFSTVKTASGYSQADMQALVQTSAASSWAFKPTFGGTPFQQKLAEQQFTQTAAAYMQQHPENAGLTPAGLDAAYKAYFASGGVDKPMFGYGPAGETDKRAFLNGMEAYADAHKLNIAALPEVKGVIAAAGGALHVLQSQAAITDMAEKQIHANEAVVNQWIGKTGLTNVSPFLNKWLTTGETFTGNSNVPPYVAALITVASEYARIRSGSTGAGGITEGAREEAVSLLSSATTPQALANIFSVINTEAANKSMSFALASKAVANVAGNAENAASTDSDAPNPFDQAPGTPDSGSAPASQDQNTPFSDPNSSAATYYYNPDGTPSDGAPQ